MPFQPKIVSVITAPPIIVMTSTGMIEASGQRSEELCAACFDGHYPIELPDDSAMSAAVRAHAAEVGELEIAEAPDSSEIADAVHRL